ncbi:hypothetical protein LY78DRAFT_126771 [Colletotrichum sublineola]|nr:hypothetical protein LY78DRAFT_126771 [Colletotrichum sublineola]
MRSRWGGTGLASSPLGLVDMRIRPRGTRTLVRIAAAYDFLPLPFLSFKCVQSTLFCFKCPAAWPQRRTRLRLALFLYVHPKVGTYSACRYSAINSLRPHSRCAAIAPAPVAWIECSLYSFRDIGCSSVPRRRLGTGHRDLTARGPRWNTIAEFILFSPSLGCIGPGYLIRRNPLPPGSFSRA